MERYCQPVVDAGAVGAGVAEKADIEYLALG